MNPPRGGDLDLVTHDAQKRKDWLVLTLTRVCLADTGEGYRPGHSVLRPPPLGLRRFGVYCCPDTGRTCGLRRPI